MIKVSLAWVKQALDASINQHALTDSVSLNDHYIQSVSTDTRSLKKGDLFIALTGPNFDGHNYLQTAIDNGASAVVVSKETQGLAVPALIVKDTRLALGTLGAAVKESLNIKTVGITGSSGKTTVKEMVNAILSTRGKVLATKGNFNNDIGVPLTLLNLNEQHDFAVIEMGANHQGEIEYTCQLVKPDVATIINAAPAHIEGFGSLFGVARAKSEIIKGLNKDAVAILNHDSPFYDFWQGTSNTSQIMTFSYESTQGDFHAISVSINKEGCAEFELVTPIGKVAIKLRVPGIHNVGNAVLAAALSISVGANLANVQQGLFNMQSVDGRLTVKMASNQIRVLDDTYNANVGSVKAAIELLSRFDGKRIFVFGDMGELGDQAPMYHQQIGEYAYALKIDALISCGDLSRYASEAMQNRGIACESNEKAIQSLKMLLPPILMPILSAKLSVKNNKTQNPTHKDANTQVAANNMQSKSRATSVEQNPLVTILVKGSRSAKMEQVVKAIMAFDSNQPSDIPLTENKESI